MREKIPVPPHVPTERNWREWCPKAASHVRRPLVPTVASRDCSSSRRKDAIPDSSAHPHSETFAVTDRGAGDALSPTHLRVLLTHDWIVAWGGAERTVEQILQVFPQADLVVGVLGRANADLNSVTRRARETWLARLPFARSHHRWFLPLYPAAFASLDTRGYDLVISSSSAFAKSVRAPAGVPHVCYCHSPPRYLWGMQEQYRLSSERAGRALSLAGPMLRRVDRGSAHGVDQFIANSSCVADRIRSAYGRESAVVYPPVVAKPTSGQRGNRTDAFLVLSRLVPYKRVDLAISAANLTGARLVIAGDGPERARLQAMAGASVTFVGEVSEVQAGNLMEQSRAMLFCGEEDFGIAPVEANAHGLPVVAYRRGGTTESLREEISAVFFDDPVPEAVADAMQRVTGVPWSDAAIRENAERFSAHQFRTEFARIALMALALRNAT